MISLPKAAALPLLLAGLWLAAPSAAHANPLAGTVQSAPTAATGPADLAATPPALAPDTAITAFVPDASSAQASPGHVPPQRKALLPEPATIAVLGIGLIGLGFLRRTRAR